VDLVQQHVSHHRQEFFVVDHTVVVDISGVHHHIEFVGREIKATKLEKMSELLRRQDAVTIYISHTKQPHHIRFKLFI